MLHENECTSGFHAGSREVALPVSSMAQTSAIMRLPGTQLAELEGNTLRRVTDVQDEFGGLAPFEMRFVEVPRRSVWERKELKSTIG